MRSLRLSLVSALAVAMLLAPTRAAFAQQTDDQKKMQQKLDELQRQIEQLSAQAKELQKQLDGNKDAEPSSAEDDLLNVAPIDNQTTQQQPSAEPAAENPADQPPATDLNTAPVANVPNPGAAKVFNPDISVIGNFLGHVGDQNPNDERESLQFDEAELALEAFVDPFAKAKFFIGASEEGAEVEEGFIQFITLPKDLVATVGKKKAVFGKANTWHAHQLPWIDQPLVIANYFGEEGLNDSGISVSKIFANPFVYLEATGEVFRGRVDDVFDAQSPNDLFYNAHLKAFKDISERSNVELGTSYARGTAAFEEGSGSNAFLGLDVTYRWKPLEAATRRSFIARTELIQNRRDDQDENAFGMYASADYQLATRLFGGLRLDSVERADDPSARDRGLAATLTFWPSEFSQLRGEYRRVNYADDFTANELLLQVQFAIGAHGAHTF